MRSGRTQHKHKGLALVAALIFIAVFMAASAGMLAMSSQNTLAAANLQAVNRARCAAESGLELVRYWMNDSEVTIPGLVPENERYGHLIDELKGVLDDHQIAYSTNDAGHLLIGSADDPVVLERDANGSARRSFYATISPDYTTISPNGTQGVNVRITGQALELSRTIEVVFTYGTRPHTVFDYGVATKGPLHLIGNTALDGVTIASESDVYIESRDNNNALAVEGNSQIAGKVKIVNPGKAEDIVSLKGGQSSIGGERNLTHVSTGVEATEFPYPDAKHFETYATGGTLTADDSALFSQNITLENVIIKAGTNPSFTGGVTIKGILYVESPNVVNFGGTVNITGIIVGDGDMNDHSQTNQMVFRGNVSSQGVSELDESYGALRNETGTFLMAPGFFLSFGGDFGTVNGAIVGNGIEFFGNAGGTIEGSVINYSPEPMNVTGNSDLYFNRSGITEIPAGFVQELVLHYAPESYREVASY
ncbi:MAG: hypothetical protein GX298_04060 [Planctomycetes bacterium]|nr:hypothetical protein [Planctomycetota bacterium]